MADRPRILIVTRNFPPLTGGMERLNQQVLLALQKKFDTALCGPQGCAEFANGASCNEFPASPAWRYVLGSLWNAFKMALKFKPDLIYAGSGAASHAAMLAGLVCRAPVITYLHGLDIIAPDRIYQIFFLPLIRRSDAVIVNSRNTARLALQAGIKEHRINIIHPGVELPNIEERFAQRAAFRTTHGVGDRPMLLAAGRLTARKGLVEFIEHCMPEIVRAIPDIRILIIGDAPVDALGKSARDIVEEIRAAATKLGLEQHIQLLGKVEDKELSSSYFAADLFVFPVLDLPGDVEGFGMVAVEAAAHGLPTVGFAAGGVPDAVAANISGQLAAPGNYAHLTDIVIERLTATSTEQTTACRRHAASFSWVHFGQKMRDLCLNAMRR
jgi:phosphatidylinositol alpha-1,6-mannosyltransferase